MKITKYLLLLTAILGVLGHASRPSDKKCINLAKEFVGKYRVQTTQNNTGTGISDLSTGNTTGTVTVEDNYFFKSICYTKNEKTIHIGYASFGRVKLSYSTSHKEIAEHTESMHPMLKIFYL